MTASAIHYSPLANLNVPRIGAWSATIGIHLVILAMLLSAPAALQLIRKTVTDPITQVTVIERSHTEDKVPPLPVPLVHVRTKSVHPTAPTTNEISSNPIPTDHPHNDAPTAPPGIEAPGNAIPGPVDSEPTAIAYNTRTSVAYPRDALKLREQGTVMLRVLVDVDGRVLEVNVETSSGSPRLDRAARDAVKKWTFNPAMHDGIARSAWARVPITFRLSDI